MSVPGFRLPGGGRISWPTTPPVDPWFLSGEGEDPSRFGYQRLVSDRAQPGLGLGGRIGSRPLIVVLLNPPPDDPNFPRLAHSPEQYQRWFFDPSTPNSVAWFFAQLGANLIPAIPGPIPQLTLSSRELASSNGIQDRVKWAIERLVEEHGVGVFQAVDDLGVDDDVLRGPELPVVMVDSLSTDMAAARPVSFTVSDLGFDFRAVALGHRVSLLTACHEILHAWGCEDLYGNQTRPPALNSFITTMSVTNTGIPDDRAVVDLDAWHRMQLGLTRPRVVDIANSPSGSWTLPSVSHERGSSALLLWDSRIGDRDYFLIELRLADWRSLDRDVRSGFVVWRVSLAEDGSPRQDEHFSMVRAIGRDLVPGSSATWWTGDQVDGLWWAEPVNKPLGVRVGFQRRDRNSGVVTWGPSPLHPQKRFGFEWPRKIGLPDGGLKGFSQRGVKA